MPRLFGHIGLALTCVIDGRCRVSGLKSHAAQRLAEGLSWSGSGALDVERSKRFEASTKLFENEVTSLGRQPLNPKGALLDFEVEYGKLQGNADIVVAQLYWDLKGGSCANGPSKPLIEKPNDWFTVGVDGGSLRRQIPLAITVLEITSARFNTPQEVLNSEMLTLVDDWFNRTNHDGQVTPGTDGHLALQRSAKLHNFAMHYTVGLPLEKTYDLMQHSLGRDMWNRTEARCAGKPKMYKAVVALASMTAWGVTRPSPYDTCIHAKRHLHPWLVRTHHGDLVAHVKEHFGAAVFHDFKEDVLAVSGAGPVPFPDGVVDYLHMPEVAEVAGFVKPRNHLNMDMASSSIVKANPASLSAETDAQRLHWYQRPPPAWNETHMNLADDALESLPLTAGGVCQLAQKVVDNKVDVQNALKNLGCGVYFADGSVRPLEAASTSEWLDGILEGRDLWTDPENAFVQASSSKLVFKSMGRWRMHAGYVYLECRSTDWNCLGPKEHRRAPFPVWQKMANVAKHVQDIVGDM